jgi:hypothetical protein
MRTKNLWQQSVKMWREGSARKKIVWVERSVFFTADEEKSVRAESFVLKSTMAHSAA